MATVYKSRIRKALALLREQHVPSALLLSSSPVVHKSRDEPYPYRQGSDFYYLTGCSAQEVLLLLSSATGQATRIAPLQDKAKVIWTGAAESCPSRAEQIGAGCVITAFPEREVQARLQGVERLFFQNDAGALAWDIARRMLERPSFRRGSFPISFFHCDAILSELRLIKEPGEIKLIAQAAQATNQALQDSLPFLRAGSSEADVAATLDYFFQLQGCRPAFNTIVASGAAAATLHHCPGKKLLRRGEMVLIDCGAELQRYCADITRVLPVNGRFDDVQRDLVDVVVQAQKKAIAAIKPGRAVEKLHGAAAAVLTAGLRDLGVIKGKLSSLIARGAFKPYFPHSIGHNLGLDVHDPGGMRESHRTILKPGMVITIEPGLYFSKKVGRVAAGGVRIEDDVLVTSSGARLLSAGFPKDIADVEALLNREELARDFTL